MFYGIQDFDFTQIYVIKFAQILITFAQISHKFPQNVSILPPKNLVENAAASLVSSAQLLQHRIVQTRDRPKTLFWNQYRYLMLIYLSVADNIGHLLSL